MTDEDKILLAQFREEGKKDGTIENFIYSLLSTAHPAAIDKIEKQAVLFQKIGTRIGRDMSESENDPKRKAEWMSLLDRLSSRVNSTPFEDDTDEDK